MLDDDELWELDDFDDEEPVEVKKPVNEEEEEYVDDRDQIADSIVMGVSDYQEVRYGSVRFERE